MRSPDPQALALSFGAVAAEYQRGRPSYPREAVEWMAGSSPATVVEVGAGTGKLTDVLIELRHDVLACEPSAEMLAILRERHPLVRTATCHAEELPAASRSADVVIAAQCLHWLDPDRALTEAARVLKPKGRFAAIYNHRDSRVPWIRKLNDILGDSGPTIAPDEVLVASGRFGYVEEQSFRHWQPMGKPDLRALALSQSKVAVLDPRARDRVTAAVDELYDFYDRGPAGLLMPWVATAYRAVVKPGAQNSSPATDNQPDAPEMPPADDDPSTTLIDFR